MTDFLKKNFFSAYSLCFLSPFFFSGCSHSVFVPPTSHHITLFSEKSNPLILTNKNNSGTVFFRPANNTASQQTQSKPVNIYVNHSYVASLLPSGYTFIQACPGTLYADATENDVATGYAGKLWEGLPLSLKANKIKYIKISIDSDLVLTEVAETEFLSLQNTLAEQIHTMPRIAKPDCPSTSAYGVDTVNSTILQPPKNNNNTPIGWTYNATLNEFRAEITALFNFSKSDIVDITPNSLDNVLNLISELNNKKDDIKFVQLTGYTDPVGDYATNKILALNRVNSLANILTAQGVNSNSIWKQVHGAQNFVIDSCNTAATGSARDTCNLPNRRVEIKLIAYAR